MSRFLVTGGAGFIGSHITEALIEKGHSVRVLDNFSTGRKENLKKVIDKIELVRGDIRSLTTCIKASRHIDFILHQAALISVPESMERSRDFVEVNVKGTLNLLDSARGSKVKCFVFASSSSVYGENNDFPSRENALPQPVSIYALTKLSGEHYCRIFSRYYGLPTVSLRYFNVFGPRQSPDSQYAGVIAKFISCVINGQAAPVYGTGRQSRDFIYAQNVVEANILAAGRSFQGEVFNIASGKDQSILRLLGILNRLLQGHSKAVFLKPRPADVFRTLADISKSRRVLGFKPSIGFIKGLDLTAQYFKENG